MRRIIVDYKKLTPEILSLLVEKYPDGYDDNHIISFKNAKNEWVDCVEVKTEDTVYLVKVSARLEVSMANFDEDDYNEAEFNEPISELPDKEALDTDLDLDDEQDGTKESSKKKMDLEEEEGDEEDFDDDDDDEEEDEGDFEGEDDEDDED
ncbi:MAG: DNA primase [Flavobacteriaceae bacterium]